MKTNLDLRSLPLLPLALLLSALFSFWVIYCNPVLNDDAFTYLQGAELYKDEGLSAVLDTYGWYAYSILIALLDALAPGDLITSAHLLNSLFYLQLTWAFLRLSLLIWPGTRAAYFAAIVILGFPLLNEMRYFIIRDAGYWAFSLTALLYLLRYSRNNRLADALLWCLSALAAVVFRLEALLPLVAAPFALLFTPGIDLKQRFRSLLRIEALLLILAALILVLCMSLQINLLELMRFAYRYYLPLLYDLGPLFRADALALNARLFNAEHSASVWLLPGMALLLLNYCYAIASNLFMALSPALALVLLAGLWPLRIRMPAQARSFLLAYILCVLLALLIFQFIMHFQTQRYASLLCLLLLLLLPGVLDHLWERARERGSLKRFKVILACFCVYFFIDSLISFGYSRSYIRDASQWVNNNLPKDVALATNVYTVAYEHGHLTGLDQTKKQISAVLENAGSADYVVVQIKASDSSGQALLESDTRLRLQQSFANKRGDAIRIYAKVQDNRSSP